MSEPNNVFPFPGVDAEGPLDISAIFGEGASGGEENPFDMPAAQGPIEVPAPSQGQTGETDPAPAPEPEPAAEQEPEQPPAAQAEPIPAPEPQPQNITPAKEPDPIASAFTKQEEKNAQQGLFEKAPVFSYGSAKEAISDPSMTFEELRIAKADDFPELAEGKRVSWTVEYGKVTKTISAPKETIIQSIKEEIERSKTFLDGLKKARDKCPDCLVKPKVTAQSKGIAAYKGVFHSLEDARSSDKTICIIPGGDGSIYELRKTELGEFIVPKNNVVEFQQIRAGFTPALPLIPQYILRQIISFFRCYMKEREEFEALAHILWDKVQDEFVIRIPKQEVSKDRIHADLSDDAPLADHYIHYADIHSHNSMAAKFSVIDDRDEQATRLYIVLGRLDQFFPEISVRMSCGGVFQPLNPAAVLEGVGEVFPHQWHDNVKKRRHIPCHVEPFRSGLEASTWGDAR